MPSHAPVGNNTQVDERSIKPRTRGERGECPGGVAWRGEPASASPRLSRLNEEYNIYLARRPKLAGTAARHDKEIPRTINRTKHQNHKAHKKKGGRKMEEGEKSGAFPLV